VLASLATLAINHCTTWPTASACRAPPLQSWLSIAYRLDGRVDEQRQISRNPYVKQTLVTEPFSRAPRSRASWHQPSPVLAHLYCSRPPLEDQKLKNNFGQPAHFAAAVVVWLAASISLFFPRVPSFPPAGFFPHTHPKSPSPLLSPSSSTSIDQLAIDRDWVSSQTLSAKLHFHLELSAASDASSASPRPRRKPRACLPRVLASTSVFAIRDLDASQAFVTHAADPAECQRERGRRYRV
jgi:hypothetical protein